MCVEIAVLGILRTNGFDEAATVLLGGVTNAVS